jgi:hypothetical protein
MRKGMLQKFLARDLRIFRVPYKVNGSLVTRHIPKLFHDMSLMLFVKARKKYPIAS